MARALLVLLAVTSAACVPSTEDPNPYGGIELRARLADGTVAPWTTSDGWTIELSSVQAPLYVGFASQAPTSGVRPCTSGSFRADGPTELLAGPIERVFRQVDVGPCALVLVPGFASLDAEGTFRIQGVASGPEGRFTFDLPLGVDVRGYACREATGQPVTLTIVNREAVRVEAVVDPVTSLRSVLDRAGALRALDADRDDHVSDVEVLVGPDLGLAAVTLGLRLADGRSCEANGAFTPPSR